jgi:hypothetical protein
MKNMHSTKERGKGMTNIEGDKRRNKSKERRKKERRGKEQKQ